VGAYMLPWSLFRTKLGSTNDINILRYGKRQPLHCVVPSIPRLCIDKWARKKSAGYEKQAEMSFAIPNIYEPSNAKRYEIAAPNIRNGLTRY
jgi:hypothetical protein